MGIQKDRIIFICYLQIFLQIAAFIETIMPVSYTHLDTCDAQTATLLAREVSDGVIAPAYTQEALEILKTKRKGSYNVIQIDEAYQPCLLYTSRCV